jgi:hypothetical protein
MRCSLDTGGCYSGAVDRNEEVRMFKLWRSSRRAGWLVLVAVAVVAAGGGYAVAAAGSTSVIHACAAKRGGALRLAAKCRTNERPVQWNVRGLPGTSGTNGRNGTNGTNGAPGAPGPGATTFMTTLDQGLSVYTAVKTLDNGLTIEAGCTAGSVSLRIVTTVFTSTIQASGTKNDTGVTSPVDVDQTNAWPVASDASNSDLDVLARDSAAGTKFARIDVHGTHGAPCRFWGMVTPSG